MIDVSTEIKFKTARSGGKGGQNVNKVETMVEGYWDLTQTFLLTPEQKERVRQKLQNKINPEGVLQVKSQAYRTQLANKEEVIRKMNAMVSTALHKEKKRIATKPSRNSREKRIDAKKKEGLIKEARRKIRRTDY